MLMTIVLLALFCLFLLLLLRPLPPPPPAISIPIPIPIPPPPPRHVSFSLVSSDTEYSLPHRRWSTPFHKRKSSAPDSPQPYTSVDQFGRILTASPASETPPSSKPSKRLSISLPGKRRSSSVSYALQVDAPPSLSRSPPQRTRFVNPFTKHYRSRTLSPPSTCKSLDTPLSTPSGAPISSSPPPRRRTLANKFKSIFKSTSPEPSPIVQSKPILTTMLRRKPAARTQPYGPPWNAPMPVPDFTLSQHSLRESAQTPQSSQKRPIPPFGRSSMSPGQLTPRTFINELDEKLSQLRQQRIHDSRQPHR